MGCRIAEGALAGRANSHASPRRLISKEVGLAPCGNDAESSLVVSEKSVRADLIAASIRNVSESLTSKCALKDARHGDVVGEISWWATWARTNTFHACGVLVEDCY